MSQTALKLLVGDDQELLRAILIIVGCKEMNTLQGKFIEAKEHIIALLEDSAFSHLLEVPSFLCYDSLSHFLRIGILIYFQVA